MKNSQKDVEYCGMWNLPFLDRGGWRLSGAWDRANIPVNVQSRMAQGAAWALACALPTRPSFGVLRISGEEV